jgi:fatty-acyl-CoA synthase
VQIFDRVRAARTFLQRSEVLKTMTAGGAVTLARRIVQRNLPKGPSAVISVHAAHHGDTEALIERGVRLTYQELDDGIDRLARAWLALGVRRGDKVALMLRNGHRYLLAQWAALRAGAAVVQIGYRLKAAEVAHILGNAEPALILHEEEFASTIAEAEELAKQKPRCGRVSAPAQFDEMVESGADPSLKLEGDAQSATVMIYTSGTTGRPKGASRTFEKSLHDSVIDFLAQVGVRHDERHLVTCPLYHSAAPAFVGMTFMLGGAAILMEHFDPEEALRTIERERITSSFMVPTMLTRMAALPEEVRRRYDVSSLRWILSGAAPLPTETARRIEEWIGPKLYNFYGATETGLVTLALPGEHTKRPGTIGRALLGNEIRILDDDGREVKTGEVGEVFVRNSMLVQGYHRDREATEKAMRDGFFSVGDLGRVDRDGYYYLADRKHDMVISGGVNIYPWEIEQHLHTHPDILEAAVIGVPDAEWGESLRAFVVRRPDAAISAEEVQRFCKTTLADYKMPRSVIFLEALPRLPTGKVLKRELRHHPT